MLHLLADTDEKDNVLAKCRLGLRAWRAKKTMLCFHAVTDEDGHPLESEDESGMRLCDYWCKIFETRVEGAQHHCHETILKYVQTALDDIQWQIDRFEFDEKNATEKVRSRSRWGSIKFLQMCGWIWLPVLTQRV